MDCGLWDDGLRAAPKVPATNREGFVNLRAELFFELRRRFMEGQIAIPDDAELASQLLALRYEVDPAGLERTHQSHVRGFSKIALRL